MAVDVDLTGLETPGCEAEVGGYRSGAFKASRIIDANVLQKGSLCGQ
jgi:hypothetical protein